MAKKHCSDMNMDGTITSTLSLYSSGSVNSVVWPESVMTWARVIVSDPFLILYLVPSRDGSGFTHPVSWDKECYKGEKVTHSLHAFPDLLRVHTFVPQLGK